jgi:hypothetical protein
MLVGVMLVAMRGRAVLVLRHDGDFAAFLLGDSFALGNDGLVARLLVMLMVVMVIVITIAIVIMLIVIVDGLAMRRLILIRGGCDGRSLLLGHGGRCLGVRAVICCRLRCRGRVMVMPIIVIVMAVVMIVLILTMIVVIMVISVVVIGMCLAEAMRVIVITMLAIVGVSFGLVSLVAFMLVFVAFGLRRRRRAFHDLALHALTAAAAARTAMAVAAAVGAVLALFLGLAVGALFGLDESLTVGDWDLIIVRVNFAEGEKAVAVAAIFDEGGLQGRLYPRDLGEVDVAAQLLALGRLEIKLLDAIAANDDNPGLFRVGSIDQHLVGHIETLGGDGRGWPRARDALSDDATVHLIRG